MLKHPSVSVLRRRLAVAACVGLALGATVLARALEAPAANAAAAVTGAPLTGDEVSITTSIAWNGEVLREDTQRTRLGAKQVWRMKRSGGPGADLDLNFEFTVKRPGPDHPAAKAGKLPADAAWISSTLTVGAGADRSVSHPSLITASGQKATIEMGMKRAEGRPERRVRITVLPRLAEAAAVAPAAPAAGNKGEKSGG